MSKGDTMTAQENSDEITAFGETHHIRTQDECPDRESHHESMEAARGAMPDEEAIYEIAELFKVFGDPTRARIICALHAGELCVCHIAELLGMTSSAISHQLRIMKHIRIVKTRREGKSIIYSLCDSHIVELFRIALEHVMEV